MNDPVLTFAAFFRARLLSVPELAAVVGTRIYNSSAPAKARLPFAVFTVVPLDDNFGQARASIQSRLLCDFKIESRLPLDPDIAPANEAVRQVFRSARTAADFEDFRISVWNRRPISRLNPGAVNEEKIYSSGTTFQATMSRVETAVLGSLIPFRAVTGVARNFALSVAGEIPFLNFAGAETNIALVSGKIPFINRTGQSAAVSLV